VGEGVVAVSWIRRYATRPRSSLATDVVCVAGIAIGSIESLWWSVGVGVAILSVGHAVDRWAGFK
jgi:hypothetical protein